MNRSFANTGGCRSCGMSGYMQSGGWGYASQTAGPSLAIAYVPSQTFGELYTSSEALGIVCEHSDDKNYYFCSPAFDKNCGECEPEISLTTVLGIF